MVVQVENVILLGRRELALLRLGHDLRIGARRARRRNFSCPTGSLRDVFWHYDGGGIEISCFLLWMLNPTVVFRINWVGVSSYIGTGFY